jgi:urate oxidase
MPHLRSAVFGESRLRLLRILSHGDRHDPKDITIGLRLEGDEALPGEPVKNAVYRVARSAEHAAVESFALAVSARLLAEFPQIRLAQIEVAERVWTRLEAGGKAQGQAFVPGSGERRVAIVTSNGERAAVTAGIDELVLMRSAGLRPPRRAGAEDASDSLQPLLVAALSARWSYGAGEIAFIPYRQGVRSAIVDTFAWHATRSLQHTLSGMADVILESYAEILSVTLTVQERPYRPVDLLAPEPDALFVAYDEPVGVVEVTVDRR